MANQILELGFSLQPSGAGRRARFSKPRPVAAQHRSPGARSHSPFAVIDPTCGKFHSEFLGLGVRPSPVDFQMAFGLEHAPVAEAQRQNRSLGNNTDARMGTGGQSLVSKTPKRNLPHSQQLCQTNQLWCSKTLVRHRPDRARDSIVAWHSSNTALVAWHGGGAPADRPFLVWCSGGTWWAHFHDVITYYPPQCSLLENVAVPSQRSGRRWMLCPRSSGRLGPSQRHHTDPGLWDAAPDHGPWPMVRRHSVPKHGPICVLRVARHQNVFSTLGLQLSRHPRTSSSACRRNLRACFGLLRRNRVPAELDAALPRQRLRCKHLATATDRAGQKAATEGHLLTRDLSVPSVASQRKPRPPRRPRSFGTRSRKSMET